MAVTIEVKDGSVAEITGPAKIVVTSDVPNSVLIDGEPVMQPPPDIPPPEPPVAPVISSLSPSTAVVGDATDITMTVNGTGFNGSSVIVFDDHDEPTTFISNTRVSTGVKPSLFVVPADCPVEVRNGEEVSNSKIFSFTASVGTQKRK